MRAAAIQLNSNEDKARNLARAERLLREAAADRAQLAVLPEKFNVLGGPDDLRAGAEPIPGPTTDWAAALCRELDLWLVAGSIVERVEGDDKLRNTSVLIGPGRRAARRPTARSTCSTSRSRAWCTASPTQRRRATRSSWRTPAASRSGMAVCYDLRFPELFRIMAVRGARVISLPAAFTVPTGRAHWEILVRARAIENQVFMIAAGQIGRHPPDHESYGHSLIVDPWGVVLAQAPDEECFVAADLDLDAQDADTREAPFARAPPAGRLPLAAAGRSDVVSTRRDSAADKRRLILDAAIRVFARAGLPPLPRVGHRAGGGRRVRPRLPLLPLQGPGARHALHRALDAAAGRDRGDRPQRLLGAREAALDRRLHH